jgi:hypothetical protein
VACDESVVGTVGMLVLPTRGKAGPGEVWVRVRGGSEKFLAWSEDSLPKGTTVLITESRGPRTVDVVAWDDTLGESPSTPGSCQNNRSGE